jgi:hypothetical protein
MAEVTQRDRRRGREARGLGLVEVLPAGGRVALFWNAADVPQDLRRAFAAVYERVLPETPGAGWQHLIRPGQRQELLAGIAAAIDAGGFTMSYTALAGTAVRR